MTGWCCKRGQLSSRERAKIFIVVFLVLAVVLYFVIYAFLYNALWEFLVAMSGP